MSAPSVQARTTSLLRSAESGAGESLERLVPLLYQELKRVAHRQLGREGSRQTLQTTDLHRTMLPSPRASMATSSSSNWTSSGRAI